MLIRIVENFLERHAMSASQFGKDAAQDPRLVADMRAGRAPRAPLDQRLRGFMDGFEQGRAPPADAASPTTTRTNSPDRTSTMHAAFPAPSADGHTHAGASDVARAVPARRPNAPKRSTADRLREALLLLSDFHGQIVSHDQKAWASITFSGARHTVALVFAGEDAVAAGERFIAALPDHEFTIPGQIVAEATVIEAEQRVLPRPRLAVRCELLLLEEG